MPTKILDHNTGIVYLPNEVGHPEPHPELNSVTYMLENGSVHTVTYHESHDFGTPLDVVQAHTDGTLTTDPAPEPEPEPEPVRHEEEGI